MPGPLPWHLSQRSRHALLFRLIGLMWSWGRSEHSPRPHAELLCQLLLMLMVINWPLQLLVSLSGSLSIDKVPEPRLTGAAAVVPCGTVAPVNVLLRCTRAPQLAVGLVPLL